MERIRGYESGALPDYKSVIKAKHETAASAGLPSYSVRYQDLEKREGFNKQLFESWMFWNVTDGCSDLGLDVNVFLDYNKGRYVIMRKDVMYKLQINIDIPYDSRSKYAEIISRIGSLVPLGGSCTLYANNIPYELDLGLLVYSNENTDEIMDVVKESKLRIKTPYGLNEVFSDLDKRAYNISELLPGMTPQMVVIRMNSICYFAERDEMKRRGYDGAVSKRHKLFISYAYEDKEIADKLVERMIESGIHMWYDRKSLDVGDRIIDAIDRGLRESDLAVIIISRNTKTALYQRHELAAALNEVIRENKAWFIIKPDDVDPDDIFIGFRGYRYSDYKEFGIEGVIAQLRQKISNM
jgi:hypothetical protein